MKSIFKGIAVATLMLGSTVAAQAQITGITDLYMVGNATPAGWSLADAVKMDQAEAGVFTYTGVLTPGEFKCPTIAEDGLWQQPYIMPLDNQTKIGKDGVENPDIYYNPTGDIDDKWVVTDMGNYTITINLNTETISAVYHNGVDAIYMLGSATGAWDSNSGTPVLANAEGKYVWEGEMAYSSENKLFKFCLEAGNWNEVTFLVPETVDYNDNVKLIEAGNSYKMQESRELPEGGGLLDWFFGLTEGNMGKYRITVDKDALTVSVEELEAYTFDPATVSELYMNGIATGTWDSNAPTAMESLGNGRFSWTGTLDYAAADDDPGHANKQFKFLTDTGDWNKVWYLIPSTANADGDIEEITTGTYDLKPCTWLYGQSGIDGFFGVTEGTNGKYTVTVDVPAMKVTLTDGEGSGVENVAVDANASVEYYDLRGIRVAQPANGIYVERSSDGNSRLVKF